MTPQIPGNAEALRTLVSKAKRDLRQEVTDQIIQMLEAGTAPWQRPWNAGALGMPFNPTTENSYRSGNAIHLMATALQRGFEDPRWLTYKQAVNNGWQVRKGEQGTQIEYWEYATRQAADGNSPDSPADKLSDRDQRPVHRVYTVFNGKQVDGIPAYEPKEHREWEVIQGAEQILENSGAKILHDRNDEAFYNRIKDQIHLPPKATFPKPADYYGTALHEMAHWTGHPGRLDRPTLTSSYRFGDTNYAKEELRAELTSVFLAAERGIPHDASHHAAYIEPWIQALKNDKNEIFRAARDANRAADFLLVLEREPSVQKALESFKAQPRERDQTREVKAGSAASRDASLGEAKALSARVLGDNVRFHGAHTGSGIYRGQIIGETQNYIIQKLGPDSAVAHMKQLLGTLPSQGENVVIRYSKGAVLDVTAIQSKSLAKELTR